MYTGVICNNRSMMSEIGVKKKKRLRFTQERARGKKDEQKGE
jgi:hypothetical protein